MGDKASNFFQSGNPCNAAACIGKLLADAVACPECRSASDDCGALRAAQERLPDPAMKAALRDEFIKLLGASDCASLRGPRCAGHCDLAAELVRKYHRKSDPEGKPRVLLLGDSIRSNYENFVRRELADCCEVVFPGENCRFAKYTLNELDRWFSACGEPDVIHWNNGLWDSAVVCKEDGMFTPPAEYLFYMSRILRELQKHCGRIVFATTTPVREGSLNQHLEFIDQLNAVIVPYMKQRGIPVNDLYSLVKPRMSEFLQADCIHLSIAGIEVCGKAVADAIRAELKKSK